MVLIRLHWRLAHSINAKSDAFLTNVNVLSGVWRIVMTSVNEIGDLEPTIGYQY